MARDLQLRLQYARLKVDRGWVRLISPQNDAAIAI
jgi:hypothetical protein